MLERPSNALVERCSKKYKNDARYSYADEIKRRLTTKFAGDYESILLAVVFLNQIYSTNLYDVYRVADHIYKKKDMILPAIETGKIEAVEMIATGRNDRNLSWNRHKRMQGVCILFFFYQILQLLES